MTTDDHWKLHGVRVVHAVVYDFGMEGCIPVLWESKAPIPMFAEVRTDVHIAEDKGVITEYEASTLLKRLARVEYAWRNQAAKRQRNSLPRAIPLAIVGLFVVLFWTAACLQLAEWFWEVVR